jgi:hypothetical protein
MMVEKMMMHMMMEMMMEHMMTIKTAKTNRHYRGIIHIRIGIITGITIGIHLRIIIRHLKTSFIDCL